MACRTASTPTSWNHDQGRPESIAPLFGKGTAPSPRDMNNFSPRVGFAWDATGNGRTILRGGFGIYYDTTIDNLRLFERADLGKPGSELFLVGADIQSNLVTRWRCPLDLRRKRYARPRDGPGGPRSGRSSNRVHLIARSRLRSSVSSAISGPLFSTEFQIPYSLQYSFGVQRELPWNMILQADYNYRKGVHEVLTYDINQHDNAINGPRLNPARFDNAVPYADSSGFSTYQALLVRLDRRFANGFQMTASYGLSRFKAFGSRRVGFGGHRHRPEQPAFGVWTGWSRPH